MLLFLTLGEPTVGSLTGHHWLEGLVVHTTEVPFPPGPSKWAAGLVDSELEPCSSRMMTGDTQVVHLIICRTLFVGYCYCRISFVGLFIGLVP